MSEQKCLQKYEDVATILLQYNADPNADTIDGETAYMMAVELYSVDLQYLLREKNANAPTSVLILEQLRAPWFLVLISVLILMIFVVLVWKCKKMTNERDNSRQAHDIPLSNILIKEQPPNL